TGHLQHVGLIVKDDDPGMADQAVLAIELLVTKGNVEFRGWEIGAERPADLHRLDGPACRCTAADLLDQLTERHAECGVEKTAAADVAGKLNRDRSLRAAKLEIGIKVRALLEYRRYGREADDIVDDRRPSHKALQRGKRRLCPDNAALAFERVQQRRLLAADIGASADADLHIKRFARPQHIGSQQPLAA